MNYGDLKSLVVWYIHRTDLDPYMNSYFSQANELISKNARLLSMETRLAISLDSENRATLPADFIEFRSVLQAVGGGKTPLTYYPRGRFEEMKRAYTSQFYGYTVDAGEIEAAKAGEIDSVYYARPALLTGDLETNAVLTAYPNLYVFGMLKYANMSIQDTETEASVERQFMAEIESANDSDEKARRSGDAPQITAR
jgi:hypothetical protein